MRLPFDRSARDRLTSPTTSLQKWTGRRRATAGRLSCTSVNSPAGRASTASLRPPRALCGERDDLRVLIAGDYTWAEPLCAFADGRTGAGRPGQPDSLRRICRGHFLSALSLRCDRGATVGEEPLSNVVSEAKRESVPAVVFSVRWPSGTHLGVGAGRSCVPRSDGGSAGRRTAILSRP